MSQDICQDFLDPLKARSAVGVAARAKDAEAESEARRALAEAKIAAAIAKAISQAPPLTPSQRDRLASLLRGGAA